MSRAPAIALAIAVLACGGIVHADDVYESVDDLVIGPVFLTPSQRELLDRQRLLPPPDPAATAAAVEQATEKAAPKKAAAGYIISSKSGRREWSDGEFISTSNVSQTAFPGEVRVIRHAPKAADDDGEKD
ncbi:MAG: hypothetical protein QNJ00_16390 [Woeseiaceae bacterium]|nr:hypothetical protein [Woeseiaceae bacterium]